MGTKDRDVEVRPGFDAWALLLRRWHSILDDYGALYPNQDAAYWYNERATLSTFTGAVWRCEGLAIEEYRCDRQLSGRAAKGRADLWFRMQTPVEEFLVEAKQGWPRTTRALPVLADELLDEALAQLESDTFTGVSKVALVFLAPRCAAQLSADSIAEVVVAARSVQHDAFAWYFPPAAASLRSSVTDAWYPGVIALARSLQRQVR